MGARGSSGCALVVCISMLTFHFLGAENVIRQQVQAFVPPDRLDAAVASGASPARIYVGYVMAFLATPIMLAAVAGALLVISMMTARQPTFDAMYSMVALAFLPYWLVTCVMIALTLMAAPDPASMDIRNLLATNVGAFMDKDSLPKGLYSLLTSLDVLSFAEIALLGYGFSKLTRVSLFAGIGAVAALWVLYVSVKMSLSILFLI